MPKWSPLLVVPAAAVLAVDPAGLAPFGPVKWALVPALVLAGFALARPPVPRRWLPFLAVVIVSATLAVDPASAWTGTPERHFGVLAWLVAAAAFAAAQTLDGPSRGRVVVITATTAALLGAWAGAEALGWRPFDLAGAGSRPVGTLGSSAFLGAAAVLLGPVTFALRAPWRWAAAGLAVVALVSSGARAAWVGAAVVAVAVAVVRRPGRRAIGIAAGLVVVVALATGATGRLTTLLSDHDGGGRGRLDEWRVAARVVAHHPLFGVGPEGYRVDFAQRVDDAYEQAHGRDPLPDRAHSALLDIAATTGLVGLAAYLALVGAVGRILVRAVRTGSTTDAALAAGVLAYWVQSLFLFPIAELEPVAWLLAGVVASRHAEPGPKPTTTTAPRAVPVLAGALAVVCATAGALDIAADRAARTALADGPAASTAQATRARRLRPDAPRYRLVAARTLEQRATPTALRAAIKQLGPSSTEPVIRATRARLLLDLARLTDQPADLATARAFLERLAIQDPRNAEVLLRLGVARSLSGDARAAEQAWLRAERLAPRSAAAATDLALSYAQAGRWPEATAAATRALAVDPDNERARRVLEGGPDGT